MVVPGPAGHNPGHTWWAPEAVVIIHEAGQVHGVVVVGLGGRPRAARGYVCIHLPSGQQQAQSNEVSLLCRRFGPAGPHPMHEKAWEFPCENNHSQ